MAEGRRMASATARETAHWAPGLTVAARGGGSRLGGRRRRRRQPPRETTCPARARHRGLEALSQNPSALCMFVFSLPAFSGERAGGTAIGRGGRFSRRARARALRYAAASICLRNAASLDDLSGSGSATSYPGCGALAAPPAACWSRAWGSGLRSRRAWRADCSCRHLASSSSCVD